MQACKLACVPCKHAGPRLPVMHMVRDAHDVHHACWDLMFRQPGETDRLIARMLLCNLANAWVWVAVRYLARLKLCKVETCNSVEHTILVFFPTVYRNILQNPWNTIVVSALRYPFNHKTFSATSLTAKGQIAPNYESRVVGF